MTISIRPLKPSFGAEVLGASRVRGKPDWLFRTLNYLWGQHRVLLFRDCDFSEAEQVEFSSMFGALEVHGRIEYNSKEHPQLLYITNKKYPDGKPMGGLSNNEAGWHFDQSYLPRPALGSMLYAVEVPPSGGNTSFGDLYGAYDALPEAMKQRLDGMKAVHSYDQFNRQYSEPANNFQRNRSSLEEVHPVIRTHPITLRKALYVSPSVITHFVGLPANESDALLKELSDLMTRPEFVYEHEWRPGDAILWDNACTIHRREKFSDNSIRFMRRTTIRPPEEVAVPF